MVTINSRQKSDAICGNVWRSFTSLSHVKYGSQTSWQVTSSSSETTGRRIALTVESLHSQVTELLYTHDVVMEGVNNNMVFIALCFSCGANINVMSLLLIPCLPKKCIIINGGDWNCLAKQRPKGCRCWTRGGPARVQKFPFFLFTRVQPYGWSGMTLDCVTASCLTQSSVRADTDHHHPLVLLPVL